MDKQFFLFFYFIEPFFAPIHCFLFTIPTFFILNCYARTTNSRQQALNATTFYWCAKKVKEISRIFHKIGYTFCECAARLHVCRRVWTRAQTQYARRAQTKNQQNNLIGLFYQYHYRWANRKDHRMQFAPTHTHTCAHTIACDGSVSRLIVNEHNNCDGTYQLIESAGRGRGRKVRFILYLECVRCAWMWTGGSTWERSTGWAGRTRIFCVCGPARIFHVWAVVFTYIFCIYFSIERILERIAARHQPHTELMNNFKTQCAHRTSAVCAFGFRWREIV